MAEVLHEQSLGAFLDALASNAPTPGGGSVAALSGAMAAGLISMTCAIMLRKNNNGDQNEEQTRAIQSQAEKLRREFQELAQADINIFDHLSAAYKLPRTTDADAATRRSAIQGITRKAAEVPLATARNAVALLPLCTSLVNRCGRLLVSDLGVAALLAQSTVHTALLNVEINLSSLQDQLYVKQVRAQIEDLTMGLDEETRAIVEIVRTRINS